ncbi:MAG: GIY-YIG nuclease family protein [Kiritimatiellia bacterium]|jgi:predicted GIY-YIG superfamily endonuclease|nr:GIY-YIG nuclease family protein [Kiritimatiellia bacterium]MDP6810745.1 GIY-YIG nuclease family protein [Kiritimatiellia bacterium]MDP7022620.1 GIY-YIG nuclease family protein [Kiritimatiellia bacterium]
MPHHTYILECSNGSYYVGHTRDVQGRIGRHRNGTGARHTAVHGPDRLVYSEAFETETEAIRRERQLKRWTRAKKQALIEGRLCQLRQLSRSHDHKQ